MGGFDGLGHTRAQVSSRQYSRIRSKRYFCRSSESPWGVIGGGLSTTDGCHTTRNNILSSSSATAVFFPWMVTLKAEVMVLLDTIQAAEVRGKEPSPISGRHDGTTILGTDQLADVTCRGLLDYVSQVVQRADVGFAKLPLDETEPSVGGELRVASNHEVQFDGLMQTCEHSAHKVLHHGVVFVLATAVVSM